MAREVSDFQRKAQERRVAIVALRVGQTIELPSEEETFAAIRYAEWDLGRGLGRLSTRGSTADVVRITRVIGGLF